MGDWPVLSKDEIQALTEERGSEYGDFSTQGLIAQDLKERMRSTAGWGRLSGHQREALDMIQHKISRILNGNPNNHDSWIDIAGYAKITADRIPRDT